MDPESTLSQLCWIEQPTTCGPAGVAPQQAVCEISLHKPFSPFLRLLKMAYDERIDYGHSLLRARPNFTKALHEFQTFLKATLKDLQVKHQSLLSLRNANKTNRNVKTYLSCQIYLLRKHLRRLEEFDMEICSRLKSLLDSTTTNAGDQQQETEISFGKLTLQDRDEYLKVNVNAILKVDSKSGLKESLDDSIGSRRSKNDSIGSNSSDSSSSCSSSPCPPLQGPADNQLLQILADINKMKRRCKHILDVTDKYCVLGSNPASSSGSLDEYYLAGDSSCDSSYSADSSSSLPSPVVPGNMFKTTLESVGSHLAVIAKTYTKRHSSNGEPSNTL